MSGKFYDQREDLYGAGGFRPLGLGEMVVVEVEPGTKIKDPRTGREIVVTDTEGAALNGKLYVTKTVLERIKAVVPERRKDR